MTEQVETLRNVVTAAMAGGVHSEEELRTSIAMFRSMTMFDGVSDEESELLFKQLTKSLLIELDLGVAVTSSDFEPWLESTKASIDWRRWKTYKQWLLQSGRPPRVVERLDELTDAVLELAGSPRTEGTWGRRGLVIGDVQSGKTGTYLGLFNKAVDAGYRLIIVLAGSTESLRQQTQARVDEGLIGRDSRGVPKELRCPPGEPAGYGPGGGASCVCSTPSDLEDQIVRELRDHLEESRRAGYVLIRAA